MRACLQTLRFHSFLRHEQGSTAPIFAVSIMAIVSLAGAAIALGMDSRAANALQLSADDAALSGATAFINATSPRAEDRIAAARQLASASAVGNTQYALNTLDVSQIVEDPYGQHTMIKVDLAFEPANPAAKILGRNANVSISRTASASATWGFPLCILALNEAGSGFSSAGAANLVAENCVIWSNSKTGTSMEFAGGDASAKFFCAGGDASVTGGQVSPRPHENCDSIPDPLHDWKAPNPAAPSTLPVALQAGNVSDMLRFASLLANGAVNYVMSGGSTSGGGALGGGGLAVSQLQAIELIEESLASSSFPIVDADGAFLSGAAAGLTLEELLQVAGSIDNVAPENYVDDDYKDSPTYTLSPGTYKGIDISEGHVRMQPGIYHIIDAPLTVRRKATLSGDGVAIIFHGAYATFNVLDMARVELSAPLEGDAAGFVLAENRNRSLNGISDPQRSRLTGSGTVQAVGTIYLPRQLLSITGDGAADQASPLLQIVAHEVEMRDQGGLHIDFNMAETDVPAKILPERTARLVH